MRLHDRQLPGLKNKLVVRNDTELNCLSVTGWERRHDAFARLLKQAKRDHPLPPCGPLLVQTTDHPVTRKRSAWRSFAFCTTEG